MVLLFPTTLMGATLPLIVKNFVRRESDVGRFGGLFYSINTLGALAGVIVAAFALIPSFGITTTTHIAVGINIAVGVVVILVSMGAPRLTAAAPTAGAWEDGEAPFYRYEPVSAWFALTAICISGLSALALEVVWTRVLTLSFSATVYSFAIMLASFLFGIFQGSRIASHLIDQRLDPMRYFGFLECGIGASVALLALLSFIAPELFGRLLWGFTAFTRGNFGFASVVAQFIVSGLLIALPTLLLGATFPAAVKICTPSAGRVGFGTGRVYAANTAGAIIGSLLAGFVFVPLLGSKVSLLVIGLLFFANGLMLLDCRTGRAFASLRDSRVLGLLAIGVVAAGVTLALPRQTVMNYNQQSTTRPDLLYHGEGVSHSVDIVRAQKGDVIMMVDGNIEADTSFTQRRHFILKGHLPLLLHPAPREIAVVGLGLGITLAAAARNPAVESIQVIELNPEMVQAHQHLRDVTGGVLDNPKVHIRIDDGRNFLSMTDRKFDMITADPIHPRISGVGYLFTEEYYRAIKERLRDGGVVCQWMPMYNISRESFDVAFRTFAQVFENASFWYVRGHGLFVATAGPFSIDWADLKARAGDRVVAKDLASIEINSPAELLSYLFMGPEQIRAYLASAPGKRLNTDANAYLEYHSPFEFLEKTKDIVRELVPFAGYDPALLRNVTPEDRAEIEKAWTYRLERVLPELEEPLP